MYTAVDDPKSVLVDEPDEIVIATSPSRIIALGVYCAYVAANQFQSTGNSFIIDQLSVYLDTSHQSINLLTVIYSALYVVLAFPSLEIFSRMGLKSALVIGLVLNALSAVTKLIAVLWLPQVWLFYVGQIFAGVSQLFCIAVPPLLAASWFPISERSMATAVGTLSTFIGVSLGFKLGPVLVNETHKEMKDFATLYGVVAAWTVLNAIVGILFVPSRPEHPPSVSSPRYAELQRERQSSKRKPSDVVDDATKSLLAPNDGVNTDVDASADPNTSMSAIWGQVKVACRNRGLIAIALTFGLGTGCLTAGAALLSQILKPFGVSPSDSGSIILVAMMAGCVACFASGPVLDKYRKYKVPLIGLDILIALVTGAFALCMWFVPVHGNNFVIIAYVFMALLMVVQVPTYPMGLELAVELSFPDVDEAVAGTACCWMMSLFAAVGTTAVSYIVGEGATKLDGVAVFAGMSGCMIPCLILIACTTEDLKRHAHEKAQQGDNDDVRPVGGEGDEQRQASDDFVEV